MEPLNTESVVKRLKKILTTGFGGKPQGRFKISYQRMQQISGRSLLNDNFVQCLSEHCLMAGITIINLGSEFAIIEKEILVGYRNVPQGIIEKILKEDENE